MSSQPDTLIHSGSTHSDNRYQPPADPTFPLSFQHTSVLSREVIDALQPQSGGLYLDATFGGGGHSGAILAASGPNGQVIGLDRDLDAINNGQHLLNQFPDRLTLIHSRFAQMADVLAEKGISQVQGILMDLGVSSHQLDTAQRGFSFQQDGPLDMRMNGGQQSQDQSASDLVNTLEEKELSTIFFKYGEERHARRIARAIVQDRLQTPFTTTRQLARLIERVMPRSRKSHQRIHPATRVFQALRIAVNRELDELKTGITAALSLLAEGGRLAIISFHSLEDRLVKHTFREVATPPPPGPFPIQEITPPFRLITRKPIMADADEQKNNRRARSARLRVTERRIVEQS
ncbi:MAG: 16S rRNA (cytosine(1402)-N(4))-methyltransferase RsmH [Magnetococcales bacterium]|nr:16S rRNA (cytosine(1402)-N(4))-methyltransferase RsmH [Magnetococcales bacterium]